MKSKMTEFKEAIESAINDPASLAPGGGLAACASWYGGAVVAKLKELMSALEQLFDTLAKVTEDMAGPLKDLGNTMSGAMEGINKVVGGLTRLPKTLSSLADKVKGPDDLKDIDTSEMKKDTDTSAIDEPLSSLAG